MSGTGIVGFEAEPMDKDVAGPYDVVCCSERQRILVDQVFDLFSRSFTVMQIESRHLPGASFMIQVKSIGVVTGEPT